MGNTTTSMKKVKRSKSSPKFQARSDEKKAEEKGKSLSESKQAMLIKLLERPEGATIDEMAKATGWKQNSVRGAMSGVLKKLLELSIASIKEKRGRIYRITT